MNWIGIKHLVLQGIENIILVFYMHKHNYVLYVQDEITIPEYNVRQPATLENFRGCWCKCTKCGKHVHFHIIGTYRGVTWSKHGSIQTPEMKTLPAQ